MISCMFIDFQIQISYPATLKVFELLQGDKEAC